MTRELMTDRDIARYKSAFQMVLLDTGTIVRTGQAVLCRIQDGLREETLQGLPPLVRLRRMKIVLQGRPDVKLGDFLTIVENKTKFLYGTYFVMASAGSTAYGVSTVVFGMLLKDGFGHSGFPTNTTVSFTNLATGLTLQDVDALVYPAKVDAQLSPTALRYEWAVWVAPGLTYPGTTTEVEPGDLMAWQYFDRPQPVSEKRPILSPVPATSFYVKSTNNAQR